MKTSVIDKEYLELNKAIVDLQDKWKNSLPEGAIQPKIDPKALEAGVPVAALTDFDFDISLFLQWIEEVSSLLIDSNHELAEKLSMVPGTLKEQALQRWAEEALVFNEPYFSNFAKENGWEEWIPQFLAETEVCPYVQRTAETVQEHIQYVKPGSGCPVCGEPARLAALQEDGKKVLICPRCQAHWHAKRLESPHCSNENHERISFITIEGDAARYIQVCEECSGYIKVIDTRQYITKPQTALLDLNTLDLDFVAQENGCQAPEKKRI